MSTFSDNYSSNISSIFEEMNGLLVRMIGNPNN